MVSVLESLPDPSDVASDRKPPIDPAVLARMTQMITTEGYTFGDVLGISDEQLQALYSWGYELQKRGRFEQAQQVFQYLCYLNHYDESSWIALGFCRERLKQVDGALQAYITAGMLDLENPIPPLRTAECLLQKGELDAAEKAAKMTLRLAGDTPRFGQRRIRAKQLLKIIDKRKRKRKPNS